MPEQRRVHALILGLLVRVWKLLKEVIRYYEENNAEIISILERPMLEAAVVATYLMTKDPSVMEDYRKCSYKDRLRLLRNLEEGSPFYETKAGKRLLKSVLEKMAFEKLTPLHFDVQKKNKWRIQGKTFYEIFAEVEHADLYAATYGMMSESIHGSWNESMDYCLGKNDDATFSAYPFSFPADIRFVSCRPDPEVFAHPCGFRRSGEGARLPIDLCGDGRPRQNLRVEARLRHRGRGIGLEQLPALRRQRTVAV